MASANLDPALTRKDLALLRGTRGLGLTTLTANEVVVDADEPEIPVGIDGETVMMGCALGQSPRTERG